MLNLFRKQGKVRVRWNDAVLYGPKNMATQLSQLETVGVVEKEGEDFLIIRSPKTIRRKDGTSHPKNSPAFYFIPRGMIEKIEPV